jgi:hypothetical protein
MMQGPYGDCRQELVFIGQQLDQSKMQQQLAACLLTDDELGLSTAAWRLFPNPFQAEFA